MYPLSRYNELFEELAQLKSPYLGAPSVALYVVAGVPSGYVADTTSLAYPRNAEPATLETFGIGSACGVTPDGAVPAVRMRALAEGSPELLSGRVSSICDTDFAEALAGLGEGGQPTLAPLCYPECVADLDTDSGGLQPQCVVTQAFGTDEGRVTQAVAACTGIPSAPQIPEGSEVCWYPRIDRVGSTPELEDDVDARCIEAGSNIQVQIVRAGGTLEPGGTSILAYCEPDPACP